MNKVEYFKHTEGVATRWHWRCPDGMTSFVQSIPLQSGFRSLAAAKRNYAAKVISSLHAAQSRAKIHELF